jgi:hypothetical protein
MALQSGAPHAFKRFLIRPSLSIFSAAIISKAFEMLPTLFFKLV